MATPNALPDQDLAGWDWRTALKAHPIGKFGGLTWLAEVTNTKRRTVYGYSRGDRRAPITWLRDVARVLGREEG